MRRDTNRTSPIAATAIASIATAALVLGACSTGDGRTLRPPRFPPPATTAPATTTPDVSDIIEPEFSVVEDLTSGESFELVAPWPNGASIPARHTCDAENLSPALTWANAPDLAVELALTVVDLDADGYVHWIVTGIDPQRTSVVENEQPAPGRVWTNTAGITGWSGPCPPPGQEHVYQFTVHALNQPLEVADGEAATLLISKLNAIAIDQGSVTGTYTRAG
jgi:Raf kinase inhibitor-like YbhB/YbcL family protein